MAVEVALIGVGGIGAYHLESLRRLEAGGRVRLVAVAEPRAERFPDLQRELAARGVRWHLDYRDLLRLEGGLRAVVIAAPIPFHFEMALACLERGVFVNLEKPPVPLIQQLEALIAADPQHRVTVGFQMILSRCIQRMKALLVEGAIGEVRTLRAGGCWPRLDPYYQRAGWAGSLLLNEQQPVFDGPATNALAHLVHNLMFLAAPTATGFAVPREVEGELYRARPTIESYDIACLRGTFAGGAEFSLAVTHATRQAMPFCIEVQGTRGWLRLSEDGAILETSEGELTQCADTTQDLLDTCYERFLEVVTPDPGKPEKRAPTYTTLADTRGYVRTTNALLLSSGGIHDIGAEHVERYESEGQGGYEVRGLHGAVERISREGGLFSELGLAWAKAHPVPIHLESFERLDLTAAAGLVPTPASTRIPALA